MNKETTFIQSIEDVKADITDPVKGTKELYQLKAITMELSFKLGLPYHEMLWSCETGKPRYFVTATRKENQLNAHILDTLTGAQYDDTL